MAVTNESSAVCIFEKDMFLNNLPVGWQNFSGKIRNINDDFTVLVNDKKIEGRQTWFECGNVGDLNAARDALSSKPIFTTASCNKPLKDTDPDYSASAVANKFIVLINTRDPLVQSVLDKAFQSADRLLNEGANFRVTIPISSSVKRFYLTHPKFYVNEQIEDVTTVLNCDVHLTHGTTAPNWADRCFSCETTMQKVVWCTCFPIFCLTGAPYLCYKKCYRGVKEIRIDESLPVKLQTGPFPAGYDLQSLLYSPAT